MKILGISAFYHDSACCVVIDGEVIFAAQEERFTRLKHDSNFPRNSIKEASKYTKIKISEFDSVVFYEKPLIKFERLLETYLENFPFGFKSFFLRIMVVTSQTEIPKVVSSCYRAGNWEWV